MQCSRFPTLSNLAGCTKNLYRVDNIVTVCLDQLSGPHHASASGDVQSSQLLPAQHFLMKSILLPRLCGVDKHKTFWCGWWGREEIILMVIHSSWDSKEEKKALTDLAQWPLQILFSPFAFLLTYTAIPSYVPQGVKLFLEALRNFWCTT